MKNINKVNVTERLNNDAKIKENKLIQFEKIKE